MPSDAPIRITKDIPYGPAGERQLLDVYLPPDDNRLHPPVIVIHGGGWRNGSKDKLAWCARDLAAHGFAAFAINHRFWPEHPYPAAILDAQRTVRWIRAHAEQYHLDRERIGGIGSSSGGYLGSMIAVTEFDDEVEPGLASFSPRIQCMVDICGPVDLIAMMHSPSAPLVQGYMNRPLAGNEDAYRQASPINHVRADAPPFLIGHGTLDIGAEQGQVPITISAAFHDRLQSIGADSTFLRLANGGHGFIHQTTEKPAQTLWQAAVPFFDRCLRKR